MENLSNKKMRTNKNHTISFNNKPSVTSTQIANSFNKQFTNTVPHTSNKTNRKIDKQVHKLPKTTFILTTSEISAAIGTAKTTTPQDLMALASDTSSTLGHSVSHTSPTHSILLSKPTPSHTCGNWLTSFLY